MQWDATPSCAEPNAALQPRGTGALTMLRDTPLALCPGSREVDRAPRVPRRVTGSRRAIRSLECEFGAAAVPKLGFRFPTIAVTTAGVRNSRTAAVGGQPAITSDAREIAAQGRDGAAVVEHHGVDRLQAHPSVTDGERDRRRRRPQRLRSGGGSAPFGDRGSPTC